MQHAVNFPAQLETLLKESLPEHLSFDDVIRSSAQALRKSIRVNTLKISVADFTTLAEEKGWHLQAIPWCDSGFWLDNFDEAISLGNALEHLAGLFYIQEASSMLPVSALFAHFQPSESSLILDAAAAPGSKTTQIAAAMNNQGGLVANEFSASRLKVLHANLQRCGVNNVALTHYNANVFGTWAPNTFDAILLDAPCSGEGTLRKDPSALDNWSLSHVHEIAQLQTELVESALRALKPGGMMVYSTCTLNQIENQQVLANIQAKFPDCLEPISLGGLFDDAHKALTREGYLHVWPQVYDCEGFFVAAFRRTDKAMPSQPIEKRLKPLPFKPASRALNKEISEYLAQQFQLTLPSSHTLYQRDDELWLFPNTLIPLTKEIRFHRIGIKLAEKIKKGFKTNHEALITLSQHGQYKAISLNAEQAQAYFQGKDIAWPNNFNGELMLSYQGTVIGGGKWVRNKIKNGLPRELVRDNARRY